MDRQLLKSMFILSKQDVLSLLDLCLDAAVFTQNENLYKQNQGTPMGSPISVVLAELTMQHIEESIMSSTICKPKLWKRYLDDSIAIIPRDEVDSFHIFLNQINPHIEFTYEMENEHRLPFLDLMIYRRENGTLSFSIYRKPTFTGNYLNFDSYHPIAHKRAVVKSLVDRAKNLCDEDTYSNEIKIITSNLCRNGYPRSLVNSINNPRLSNRNNNSNDIKYCSTPYIKGTSERVGKILREYNIQLSNKPSQSFKNQLYNVKDKNKPDENTEVVYKIECNDCDISYIGETKKQLKDRVKQHEAAVRNKTSLSLVYQHVAENNHTMNFPGAKVLAKSKQEKPRKLLEAFYTYSDQNSINRSQYFSVFYKPIIQNVLKK